MNGNITGKIIVIGDMHLGIKRFSIAALENQLSFFENQIFPYMKEKGIKTIFQLGDLFDNRTSTDINFIHVLKKRFFDKLKEEGIVLHALVGNHDIYFRETRTVTLVKFFNILYPDNFVLYEDRREIKINGNSTYVVPWIVKGEDLSYNEIKDMHNVLGHFEIRHFAMVKGHNNTSAKLTTEFFTKNTKVRNVFSGHYHIKDTKGLVKYLGTPWQINWSDYNEEKGFYVWDEDDYLEFIENESSKKYIKVKYNDSENTDRNIEVSGLFKHSKALTDDEYKELLPYIQKHEIKFFINEAKDRHFDEILYTMKESEVQATVIDNQEISEIIGTDYINETEEQTHKDTRTLIVDTVKEHKEELLPLLIEIFQEIDSTILKEV